jgi:hypothetical protein
MHFPGYLSEMTCADFSSGVKGKAANLQSCMGFVGFIAISGSGSAMLDFAEYAPVLRTEVR